MNRNKTNTIYVFEYLLISVKLSLSSQKSQHQVKSAFLLDVVVTQHHGVIQLLSSKDESLLIGWDSFFVLNLGLHLGNGIGAFGIDGHCSSSESFHEDLESS